MTIKKIGKYCYQIQKEENMLVPGRIYGNQNTIKGLEKEKKQNPNWNALTQIKNIASLKGIQSYSLALPDVHTGYGAAVGSVNATDAKEGTITFGSIGFDINCGVRELILPLTKKEVMKKQEELAEQLFNDIPAGLGKKGNLEVSNEEMDSYLENGAKYAIKKGLGFKEDLKYIEDNGRVKKAGVENVSIKAKKRARKQLGTLGSGNHYCEVQEIKNIFDEKAAKKFGLKKGYCTIATHCGSRALGHQVGTDYLEVLEAAVKKYHIKISEKEMVCAPIQSEEGQAFFGAVKAASNVAFANRQAITYLIRKSVSKVFEIPEKEIKLLYDVGHNTAKVETHKIQGKKKKLLVQRKGATRGFGPNQKELAEKYMKIGQPILVGGTMGTSSYILKGTKKAMEETFGSTIHGAGRSMSRVKAKRKWTGNRVVNELKRKRIIIKSHSKEGVAEEAPGAYKDISDVVGVMHETGISKKVVELRPLISIKG